MYSVLDKTHYALLWWISREGFHRQSGRNFHHLCMRKYLAVLWAGNCSLLHCPSEGRSWLGIVGIWTVDICWNVTIVIAVTRDLCTLLTIMNMHKNALNLSVEWCLKNLPLALSACQECIVRWRMYLLMHYVLVRRLNVFGSGCAVWRSRSV